MTCQHHAEEYVIITADMSGAELRIIAELANDPVWVEAFARKEDVHSVGTEIMYEEEWPAEQLVGEPIKNKKTGEMVPYFCEYYKLHTAETVAKNEKATIGEPMRQKCECPLHKERRDENKSTNFLLAYGGGPHTLAKRIKKKLEKAQELMALHASKFPRIWAYLDKSGKEARMKMRSFDMFGRRRLFPDPTWERAKEKFKSDEEEKLRLPKEETDPKLEMFETYHNRKPDADELYTLTHREPTSKEIGKTLGGMQGSIERQGKNHAIQGTNASIIKLAAGCGFDAEGKPYLWHVFPLFRALVLKMVHDELVVQSPKHKAKAVAALIGDAFARAAATKMKLVRMEFDYNIETYWSK
jgi:DNA polymerase I-like protein with 3'-5' exonuclease and polymerase domains